jgi:hypothetical protein
VCSNAKRNCGGEGNSPGEKGDKLNPSSGGERVKNKPDCLSELERVREIKKGRKEKWSRWESLEEKKSSTRVCQDLSLSSINLVLNRDREIEINGSTSVRFSSTS